MQTKTGKAIWKTVGDSDKEVGILFKDATYKDTDDNGNFNTNRFVSKIDPSGKDKNIGTIEWDDNTMIKVFGGQDTEEGGSRVSGYISPSTALLHELGHVFLMINALADGYDSKKFYDYLETTTEQYGHDEQYDTKDERNVTEKIERRYVKEINALEGEKGSFQRLRFNHKASMTPTNNSADVNKAPSKQQQQEEFGVKY